MNALTLRCPQGRAKHVITSAFEATRGIAEWHDEGTQIVGTPEAASRGADESIVVELPTRLGDDTAPATDAVPITVTGRDTPHGRRFVRELKRLQTAPAEDTPGEPPVELPSTASNHTAGPADGRSARDVGSLLRILFVALVMLGICFTFITMGAAMT